MSLCAWFQSYRTCPKYLVHCSCEHDTSHEANFDWWSFAHVFWGAVYGIPLFFWDEDLYSFLIALACAVFYEIIENTTCGTRLFARICCTEDYNGDNFWNSVCDIVCCMVGFAIMFAAKTFIHDVG